MIINNHHNDQISYSKKKKKKSYYVELYCALHGLPIIIKLNQF